MMTLQNALIVLCLVVPCVSVRAAESGTSSDKLQAARAAMQQADRLRGEREYAAAADAYQRAVGLWQECLDVDADHDEARRSLAACRTNLVYCLSQPLEARLNEAARLVDLGHVEEASQAYLETGRLYEQARRRVDHPALAQNRDFCWNKAGIVPIRHADRLREQQKFGEAATYYRLAIEQYDRIHKLIGEPRFAQNVQYAEHYLPQVVFEDRLVRHAEAPTLKCQTPSGEQIDLRTYRGRTVLIVFWASWCGHCRGVLPVLDQLSDQLADDGLIVLGLSVDRVEGWNRGRTEEAQELIDQLSFPNGWATESLLRDWGNPAGVPSYVWVDGDGRLAARPTIDEWNEDVLRQQLAAIRDGRPLP